MARSNHASKNCASTVAMLVKKLKIAGLDMNNITFHANTGDLGGGGVVQHSHPHLKANKVMTKTVNKFNC